MSDDITAREGAERLPLSKMFHSTLVACQEVRRLTIYVRNRSHAVHPDLAAAISNAIDVAARLESTHTYDVPGAP